MIPLVDAFKCNGCGVCVKRCPPQVIGLVQERAAIVEMLCEECGICAEVCPTDSIIFRLPRYEPHDVHECYRATR
jgi:ferredoxin